MNEESPEVTIARIDERTKLMAKKIEDMSGAIKILNSTVCGFTKKILMLETNKGYCPAHPDMVKTQGAFREENIVLKTKFGIPTTLLYFLAPHH